MRAGNGGADRRGGGSWRRGAPWIWVLSPQLTEGYNAEYTRELFDRLPWAGSGLVDDLLAGSGRWGG